MSGILLITGKNGRTVKPYGLKRLAINNMKFTFISIVIVVSCSVCASGDLEIYPGLKFDLSSEEQRRRLENGDEASFYGDTYRQRPWRTLNVDDWKPNLDLELPEQIRNLAELLERNRARTEDELPLYYNSRYEDVYDEYKNTEKASKSSFDGYDFKIPERARLLDDVRLYPHEDDFSFGDDDKLETVNTPPRERHVHEPKNVDEGHASHHVVLPDADEKSGDVASGKGALDDAKLLDDPTQFAYPPSDARFFQNAENSNGNQKMESMLEEFNDNKIRVSHRSDEAFSDEGERDGEEDRMDMVNMTPIKPQAGSKESPAVYIIAVVAGISAAATVGLVAVGIGWYNLQKHVKSASDVEYPAYGVTGPNKDASPSGDRRLAQSAQMYHYQHQKQQIIAMESRAAAGERHGSVSEADSDEENEEGDYTVYECPGLAPTGEMEVKNPLFQDDPTPAQTPAVKSNGDEKK